MLRIRFQRLGKKKAPTYRLVVSERTKDTHAGSLEILGDYRPVSGEKPLELKKDRIQHWLSVGAQPSSSVRNLLIKAGVMQGKASGVVAISKKRQGKLDQKKAAAEEAKKAAEEAKRKAEEAAKAAAEQEAAAKAAAEQAPAEESAAPEASTEAAA